MGKALQAHIDWKSAFFEKLSLSVKFSRSSWRPQAPTNHFCTEGDWLPYNFVADSITQRNFVADFLQVQFYTENGQFVFLKESERKVQGFYVQFKSR